ncbi:MAG: AtpZ/AtpI family protein [Candidatus Saccharimonadales bacterium]
MNKGQQTGPAKIASRAQLRAIIVKDLLNVTWRMLVPTMLGLFGGMYIDSILHSSPVGFLLGSASGFVAGVLLALRVLKRAQEMHV